MTVSIGTILIDDGNIDSLQCKQLHRVVVARKLRMNNVLSESFPFMSFQRVHMLSQSCRLLYATH